MQTTSWNDAITEVDGAIRLVNHILDDLDAGPNKDLATLSRQLLHAREVMSGLFRDQANEEEIAQAIWTRQRNSIIDNDSIASKAVWRSSSIPTKFWESYIEDARALLSYFTVLTRAEYQQR